jgi:hypothetical protein
LSWPGFGAIPAGRMPGHYREAQREWLSLARENIQA